MNDTIKTVAMPKAKPPGWWGFSQSGMRPAMLKAIADSDEIPAGYKSAISGDIGSLPPEINMVMVDAHKHFQNGKAVVAITVSGKSVLA